MSTCKTTAKMLIVSPQGILYELDWYGKKPKALDRVNYEKFDMCNYGTLSIYLPGRYSTEIGYCIPEHGECKLNDLDLLYEFAESLGESDLHADLLAIIETNVLEGIVFPTTVIDVQTFSLWVKATNFYRKFLPVETQAKLLVWELAEADTEE